MEIQPSWDASFSDTPNLHLAIFVYSSIWFLSGLPGGKMLLPRCVAFLIYVHRVPPNFVHSRSHHLLSIRAALGTFWVIHRGCLDVQSIELVQ